jgi:hypothetical protein
MRAQLAFVLLGLVAVGSVDLWQRDNHVAANNLGVKLETPIFIMLGANREKYVLPFHVTPQNHFDFASEGGIGLSPIENSCCLTNSLAGSESDRSPSASWALVIERFFLFSGKPSDSVPSGEIFGVTLAAISPSRRNTPNSNFVINHICSEIERQFQFCSGLASCEGRRCLHLNQLTGHNPRLRAVDGPLQVSNTDKSGGESKFDAIREFQVKEFFMAHSLPIFLGWLAIWFGSFIWVAFEAHSRQSAFFAAASLICFLAAIPGGFLLLAWGGGFAF